jgi:hypothetical protein
MIFYYTRLQLRTYNRLQFYFGKSQFYYYIFIFHSFMAEVK